MLGRYVALGMADQGPEPVPPPRGHTSHSSSGAVTVAVIAALAAVVGALAGGFATYLGNKNLQESQSRSTAVGIGRVLQQRLELAESRFQLMLDDRQLLPPDPGIGQLVPSTQDEETLASHLGAPEWQAVSVAVSDYTLFTEGSCDCVGDDQRLYHLDARQAGHNRLLQRFWERVDRTVVRNDVEDVTSAVNALYYLTGSRA